MSDDIPDAGSRTKDTPEVTPNGRPTLTAKTVGLAPIQQGVDDDLPVPLDGVVQPVPGAVVLYRGVAPGPDQGAGNVLVTVLARYQEGGPVVQSAHNTILIQVSTLKVVFQVFLSKNYFFQK